MADIIQTSYEPTVYRSVTEMKPEFLMTYFSGSESILKFFLKNLESSYTHKKQHHLKGECNIWRDKQRKKIEALYVPNIKTET